MKIGIIDYGIGNIGSVKSAVDFYNYDVSVITSPLNIHSVDVIIISGVGNFSTATKKLKSLHFWDELNEWVIVKKKPVVGICLGMQMFADMGYEDGISKGLGWISGNVVKMTGKNIRLPHIGWNEVKPIQTDLFEHIRYKSFYFMHSYHFVPSDKNVISAVTNYGGLNIVAAIKKQNIIGCQFHPEKSQGDGLRFLKNVIEIVTK